MLGLPSLAVCVSLYFLDIQTPRQRHWHCEKSLTKAASFLSISDSFERGGGTFYSRPGNTVVARVFVYTGRMWSETRAEE